jgi:hypothetical protein
MLIIPVAETSALSAISLPQTPGIFSSVHADACLLYIPEIH